MRTINKGLILAISLLLTLGAQAQLDKSVTVYKEYVPSISDAYKLNVMPKIKDTVSYKPEFSYKIYPEVIKTKFNPEPISPAKMVGEPLKKLFGNYVRLGFGSDISPLAEIRINNNRSKSASWGAVVNHHSSFGKFSINDNPYYPNFSNNSIDLYGTKFLMFKSISGKVGFNSDKIKYYGYDPELTVPIEKSSLFENRYNILKASIGYKSDRVSKIKIDYNTGIDYYYFFDKDKTHEYGAAVTADFRDWYKNNQIGFDTKFEILNRNTPADTTTEMILKINPWVQTNGKEWKAMLGVNTYSVINPDANSETFFYPNLSFNFALADRFLLTYWGFTGKIEENFNKTTTALNPFVNPDFEIKATNFKKIIYGGVKGNISSKLSFDFKTTYSEIENKLLFVNNYSDSAKMTFDAIYDDLDMVNVFAEIAYKSKNKFNFRLKGNYYSYFNIRNNEKAWYLPDFDVTLRTEYNLMDKFLIHSDFFVLGKRFAVSNPATLNFDPVELTEVYDVNLGIDYKYNNKVSGFIEFNNIIAAKYYQWNNYPTQRFHAMVGINYAF